MDSEVELEQKLLDYMVGLNTEITKVVDRNVCTRSVDLLKEGIDLKRSSSQWSFKKTIPYT